MKIVFSLLFLSLFLTTPASAKQIKAKDLVVWITQDNEIIPGMETLHVRYKGVSKSYPAPAGHTISWKAPGGLSGYYRFNDPADGTIYGSGNWDDEWKKAMEDNVVHANELPTVYYRLGKVEEKEGKLELSFPPKTRIIFQPPKLFSPANYYVIIELPEVPPQADSRFYKTK